MEISAITPSIINWIRYSNTICLKRPYLASCPKKKKQKTLGAKTIFEIRLKIFHFSQM